MSSTLGCFTYLSVQYTLTSSRIVHHSLAYSPVRWRASYISCVVRSAMVTEPQLQKSEISLGVHDFLLPVVSKVPVQYFIQPAMRWVRSGSIIGSAYALVPSSKMAAPSRVDFML